MIYMFDGHIVTSNKDMLDVSLVPKPYPSFSMFLMQNSGSWDRAWERGYLRSLVHLWPPNDKRYLTTKLKRPGDDTSTSTDK